MKLLSSIVLAAAVKAQLIPDLFEQYANEIISPDVDGYEINPEYLYDLPTVAPPNVNDTDIDLTEFGRTMQSASRLRPYQNQNSQNNQDTNVNKNSLNTNKVNSNKNSFFNKYNNYKGNKNKKTTTPEPTTTTTTSTVGFWVKK